MFFGDEERVAPVAGNASILPGGGSILLPVLTTLLFSLALAQAASEEESETTFEIVVESERVDVDPARTSAAVTVIEVDERLPASTDVATAVQSSPGTVVRRLGGLGDYSSVSIRGSSSRHVQVFIDGVPLNPDGGSSVNLSELPLTAFERIEIYRGNAPAELGAAPVGGVVNLVTGTSESTASSVGYGALSTARSTGYVSRSLPLSGHDVDMLAFAEFFGTRGDYRYFSDNGTPYELFDDSRPSRANNGKSQLSSHFRVGTGEADRVSLSDAFLARDEGVPGHLNSPTSDAHLQTWRNLATLQTEQRPGTWSLSQRLWLLHRHESFDDRSGEVGTGVQWNRYQMSSLGLLAHAGWVPSPSIVPSLTLSFRRDSYRKHDFLADRTAVPRVRLAGVATFAANLWAGQERVRLSPVLQLDYLDNRLLGNVPFEDTAIAPDGHDLQVIGSPRLGLLLRPLEWLALKANGGRFFRAPDFTELFGDRGGIIGNTDLLPELGWQVDVGVRANATKGALDGALEVTAFLSRVDNKIVYVQNGQGTSVPRNFGHAQTTGLELASTVTLPFLDGQMSGTLSRAVNLTDLDELYGNRLPRVPTLELFEQISAHHKGLRLGHNWSYTSGNYWDATNWFLAPPRSIHGVFARASAGELSLELSVLNVLDKQVALVDRNPLDSADDTLVVQPINDFFGYPLPGRTWMVTFRWAAQPHEETP